MGSPVEEPDIEVAEGQGEEPPQQSDGEESGADTGNANDDGWSINDVPPELRGEVEKAIKPFHSRTTKAEQEAKSLSEKVKELEDSLQGATSAKDEVEKIKVFAQRVLTDDQYREHVRKQSGYKAPQQGEPPEGWNSPEAIQARQLLFQEIVGQIEKTYNFSLSDLPRLSKSASTVDSILRSSAEEEIGTTRESITKEGLPWNDEILDACINYVGRQADKEGKQITLRKAYDTIIMPIIEAEKKKAASTDSKIKDDLPQPPTNKGGDPALTGDAKLKSVIENLGLPGSFDD